MEMEFVTVFNKKLFKNIVLATSGSFIKQRFSHFMYKKVISIAKDSRVLRKLVAFKFCRYFVCLIDIRVVQSIKVYKMQ